MLARRQRITLLDLAVDAATAARDETQAASEAIGQANPLDCE